MDIQKQESPTTETTATEQPKMSSPEEMRQRYATTMEEEWDKIADGERMKSAQRRGYVTGEKKLTADGVAALYGKHKATVDEIVTVEQLRKLIVLEGDTMRYTKTIGDRKVPVRMATGKLGFFSWPKPVSQTPFGRARKKARPNQHQQTIKNISLGIFRNLFNVRVKQLELEAQAKGEKCNGIPNEELPKIGTQATTLAIRVVKHNTRALRRRKRRTQELSRRINRGLTPGNVNKCAYIGR